MLTFKLFQRWLPFRRTHLLHSNQPFHVHPFMELYVHWRNNPGLFMLKKRFGQIIVHNFIHKLIYKTVLFSFMNVIISFSPKILEYKYWPSVQ